MWTWTIDLSYLGTIVIHLQPIMTRVLPLVWTALILWWLLSIIKK